MIARFRRAWDVPVLVAWTLIAAALVAFWTCFMFGLLYVVGTVAA